MHARTSLAMVVVEYDFFERGLPDLPTPLLSSSRAWALTPDLASASTCGPQQPEVAPMPMMKTRRGRLRRRCCCCCEEEAFVAGGGGGEEAAASSQADDELEEEEEEVAASELPLPSAASLSSSTSSYQICVPSSGELMYGMRAYFLLYRWRSFFRAKDGLLCFALLLLLLEREKSEKWSSSERAFVSPIFSFFLSFSLRGAPS